MGEALGGVEGRALEKGGTNVLSMDTTLVSKHSALTFSSLIITGSRGSTLVHVCHRMSLLSSLSKSPLPGLCFPQGSEGQYSPRQRCVTKCSLAPNLWGDWKLCLLLTHSQHVRVLRLLPDPGERTLFKSCFSEFLRVIWLHSPGIRWHQGEWWCGRPCKALKEHAH